MQSDANFTARDRRELANPPYKQAWFTPLEYQRQVVEYGRKEPPGSILVDSEARYVYYVLPEGKAIRYGAIVGEDGQAPAGVATVRRKEKWPGWTPTEDEKRRLGPSLGTLPNLVRARCFSFAGDLRRSCHPASLRGRRACKWRRRNF